MPPERDFSSTENWFRETLEALHDDPEKRAERRRARMRRVARLLVLLVVVAVSAVLLLGARAHASPAPVSQSVQALFADASPPKASKADKPDHSEKKSKHHG